MSNFIQECREVMANKLKLLYDQILLLERSAKETERELEERKFLPADVGTPEKECDRQLFEKVTIPSGACWLPAY